MNGYSYHLYAIAAHYGSKPVFHHKFEIPAEGFASLYAVDKATSQAIQSAGTTKGFKGVVYSPQIWLDFDNADAAERAGSKLETMGVTFVAYTTGNRGLHFALDRSPDSVPSHLIPAQDRQWVKQEFPEADASIYTHLHPFRIEGTSHEKTGRRKERIYHHSGNAVVIPPLKDEALPSYSDRSNNGQSVFDSLKLMANTVPVQNGERQYFLIRQIYALKELGHGPDIALWWTKEWSKLLADPKSDEEIEKAVKSIYGQ